MSATGRGTTRDPKDFYATPRAAFHPLLDFIPFNVDIWDPCCGDGRLVQWFREAGFQAGGTDLYPNALHGIEGGVDYLKDETDRDFVLTNPPFSVAFEMCQHAKKHSREFMFLLRLSFLESDNRGAWLSANEPSALFVLRTRPSFVMSVTCKSVVTIGDGMKRECRHNWLLPVEAERPKVCPACGGSKLAISTSDNSGYAWFYWGDRFRGIQHI